MCSQSGAPTPPLEDKKNQNWKSLGFRVFQKHRKSDQSLKNETNATNADTSNSTCSKSVSIDSELPESPRISDQTKQTNAADTNNMGLIGKRKSKEMMEFHRTCALQELIHTEREYVKDLSMIVDGYIKFMKDPNSKFPMPEDLKSGKDEIVFANVDKIYRWHRDTFVKALESCLDNKQDFGSIFKKHENKLLMYVNYCQRKPLSEYIVSEHFAYFEAIRNTLNHKLQLCDLLIKPVQRITKYQLMLSEICKNTDSEDEIASLKEAEKIMQNILNTTNVLMKFGCLEKFEGEIALQGKLLHHGILRCTENNPCGPSSSTSKIKEYLALLFEQSIIFSVQSGKDINPDYVFRYQFMLNKMKIKNELQRDDGNGWFVLISTDCKKPNLTLFCCTKVYQDRAKWIETINSIISINLRIIQALTDPISNVKVLNSQQSIKSTNDSARTSTSKLRTDSSISSCSDNNSVSFEDDSTMTITAADSMDGSIVDSSDNGSAIADSSNDGNNVTALPLSSSSSSSAAAAGTSAPVENRNPANDGNVSTSDEDRDKNTAGGVGILMETPL